MNADLSSRGLPPQNIEAEKSLLGGLILDSKAIMKVVDSLLERDFYLPQHQKIYQAMVDLFQAGAPIDILSIANRLKEKATRKYWREGLSF